MSDMAHNMPNIRFLTLFHEREDIQPHGLIHDAIYKNRTTKLSPLFLRDYSKQHASSLVHVIQPHVDNTGILMPGVTMATSRLYQVCVSAFCTLKCLQRARINTNLRRTLSCVGILTTWSCETNSQIPLLGRVEKTGLFEALLKGPLGVCNMQPQI